MPAKTILLNAASPTLVVDPLAPAVETTKAAFIASLDSAVRNWNAEAKHRLRLAGWPVQGGMTVHTINLMRGWMEDVLLRLQPVAAHLTLPATARFPDLTSPNACLLACSLLPVLREGGLPLCVEVECLTETGQWETRAPPGQWEETRESLASALGPGLLWKVDETGRAAPV